MLAATRRPYNPNRTSTDDTGWDKEDLTSFLTDIQYNKTTLLKNDAKISNKTIDQFKNGLKRELVAEIIRTINFNALKIFDSMYKVQKLNNQLLYETKNRNNSIGKIIKKMKYFDLRTQRTDFLLARAIHIMPDIHLNDIQTLEKTGNILDIVMCNDTIFNDEDFTHFSIEENLNKQTQPLQNEPTISTQLPTTIQCVSNMDKIDTQSNKSNANTASKLIVDENLIDTNKINTKINFEPQTVASTASDPSTIPKLNINIANTIPCVAFKPIELASNTTQTNIVIPKQINKNNKKSKHSKNKRKYNKRNKKNKYKNINKKQPKQQLHTAAADFNGKRPPDNYFPSHVGLNPIRNDIQPETRYTIYNTRKVWECQSNIMPYDEYIKNEQYAYNELKQKINYAIFNIY